MSKKSAIGKATYLACAVVAVFLLTVLALDPAWPTRPAGGACYFLLASLLFCLVLFHASLQGRLRAAFRWPALLMVAFLLAAAVTAAVAADAPLPSLLGASPFLSHFVLFSATLVAAADRDFGKVLIKTLLAAGFLLAMLGIYRFLAAPFAVGSAPLEASAPLLVLLLFTDLGLLFNAIHERMDPSVDSRRILYAIGLVAIAVALYYGGSVFVWGSVAAGAACFAALAGRAYFRRNARGLLLAGAVVAALAAVGVGVVLLSDHPPAGYGEPHEQLRQAGAAWRAAVARLADHPLGTGFARAGIPGPSPYLALARDGGIPGLLLLPLFFLAALWALRPRTRSAMEEYETPRVEVFERRAVPAIELSILAVLGGAAALLFFGPAGLPLARVHVAVVLLPLWLIFFTVSFSYKHFAVDVFNKRDFVTVGLTAGITAMLVLSAFVEGSFAAAPTALGVALLAVGQARAGKDGRGRLDLRERRFFRLALGALSVVVGLACLALLAGLAAGVGAP